MCSEVPRISSQVNYKCLPLPKASTLKKQTNKQKKTKKKKQENNTWAKWGYQRRETKNVTNSGAAEIQ